MALNVNYSGNYTGNYSTQQQQIAEYGGIVTGYDAMTGFPRVVSEASLATAAAQRPSSVGMGGTTTTTTSGTSVPSSYSVTGGGTIGGNYTAPTVNPTSTVNPAPTTPPQTIPQQENAKYLPQLENYMQGDPSGGYGAMLQQMMQGNFSSNDPSYQWRFQQGQQAVERSAAAKGLLNSGNAAIELQQYGQNAASQEYQAQFTRTLQALGQSQASFQSGYNRLAELAGMTAGQQENTNNLAMQATTLGANMALGYSQLGAQVANQQNQLGLGYAQLAEKSQADQMANQLGYAQVQSGFTTSAMQAQNAANAQYQQMVNQQQTTQGFEDALIQQQWQQAAMGMDNGGVVVGAMPGYDSGSINVGTSPSYYGA